MEVMREKLLVVFQTVIEVFLTYLRRHEGTIEKSYSQRSVYLSLPSAGTKGIPLPPSLQLVLRLY